MYIGVVAEIKLRYKALQRWPCVVGRDQLEVFLAQMFCTGLVTERAVELRTCLPVPRFVRELSP